MNGRLLPLVALALGGGAVALPAQSAFQSDFLARAIAVRTRANPVPDGGALTELRVVQPVLMGMATGWNGHLQLQGTLNLESLTIPKGELTTGAWGEGFVDRRHPHTTVHEVTVSLVDLLGRRDGPARFGVVVGKGFAPFGTDDPMSRPFERYPVNHHLSQILERAVAIAQYDLGTFTAEAALFNGDEPEHPSQWPLLRTPEGKWRFGDSWSSRVTLRPVFGLEMQGSLAHLHSPEHREGAGGEVRKASASLRWQRTTAWGERYLLAEWARTSELDGLFVFHSVLVEGSIQDGDWTASYQFERTERPEEPRLDDPFRSQRPHLENSIIGIGRWTLHSFRLERTAPKPSARIAVTPFVEFTVGKVRKVGEGIFDPEGLYGKLGASRLSVGVTLDYGARRHRMGRYGVLAGTSMSPMGSH